MTHSLAWKERRENRPMLAAGLATSFGIALLVSSFALADDATYVLAAVTDMMPQLFLTLLWSLFIALFGAATFSAEKTGKTLDFLVSRRRLATDLLVAREKGEVAAHRGRAARYFASSFPPRSPRDPSPRGAPSAWASRQLGAARAQ